MYNGRGQVLVPRMFIANYQDFNDGFRVLRKVRPIGDSIAEASKLWANPEVFFGPPVNPEKFSIAMLAHAMNAGLVTGEHASTADGMFRYVTASECYFGWDRDTRGYYTFFVNVWDFHNPRFRKEITRQMFRARWILVEFEYVGAHLKKHMLYRSC